MKYGVKPGESNAMCMLGLVLIIAFFELLAVIIGLLLWARGAHAAEINYGSPPPGFFACADMRHDPACALDPTSASAIPENAELKGRVERVNAAVNGALRKYECADIGYNGPDGKPSYWASYDPEHPVFALKACVNCINYAATKRRVLLAEGLPANALRYARVRYKWSAAMTHIILLAYTSAHPSDPLVLDSLSVELASPDAIFRWSQVGPYYDLLEIQDAHGAWRKAF